MSIWNTVLATMARMTFNGILLPITGSSDYDAVITPDTAGHVEATP
ncbi:hypothetical protein ANO14919_131400 [Xylariales sp. No.14919]|nr:hypothetical protein ANO14919_131400 [Xylariales sp. No.14919]